MYSYITYFPIHQNINLDQIFTVDCSPLCYYAEKFSLLLLLLFVLSRCWLLLTALIGSVLYTRYNNGQNFFALSLLQQQQQQREGRRRGPLYKFNSLQNNACMLGKELEHIMCLQFMYLLKSSTWCCAF